MNKKFKIFILFIILIITITPITIFCTNYLYLVFLDKLDLNIFSYKIFLILEKGSFNLFLIDEIVSIILLYLVVFVSKKSKVKYKESTVKITENIEVPKPTKNKQHYGSAWWTDKKEFDKVFEHQIISKDDSIIKDLLNNKKINIDEIYIKNGGIVLGLEKGLNEKIYYNADDTHSMILGATRSGKSRSVVLQSIGLQALASENIVVSDPKGEIYCYTKNYLENLNYEVIAIDFEEPEKSSSYNFLQNIIDYVNDDDLNRAVDETEDVVKMLMGKQNGEPIWVNGETSVLATAILIVVIENKERPEYQNLTNVYHFIATMCTPNEKGQIMLNKYIEGLPNDHIAKLKAGISLVAPSKTRGSFYTSALTTLTLFSNGLIYEMTKKTDFDMKDTDKKRAIFIILPDQKETYYKLASLFITNHYNALISSSKKNGNRLNRRVNYNLDEFGNFSEIVGMKSKITVAGGYGIRFNLFLQSFSQLDEIYGKEVATTLKDNAETMIYLKSNDIETQKIVSEKLGNYTTLNVTESNSIGGAYTSSTSYLSRNLLTSDEVKRLARPNTLVIKPESNAIFNAPDLTKYYFNKMFGLGDKAHNQKVIEDTQNKRYKKDSKKIKIELWNIFEIDQFLEEEEYESYD